MSLTLAAAIVLAATAARPHSSDGALPGPQAEAAILQIESETVAAYLKGDVEKLDRIWADEYGCFLSNDAVLAKPDYLAGLRSGRIRYDVLEVESLTVQVFGDFAFASGRARVEGQDGSVTLDGLDGFLTVYHLWHGRWRAITTHAWRLPRDPSPSRTRRSPAQAERERWCDVIESTVPVTPSPRRTVLRSNRGVSQIESLIGLFLARSNSPAGMEDQHDQP